MTTADTKRVTFEEWQALPETKQRCEVVDGVMVMPPSPTDEHQWLGFEFASHLSTFVREKQLGIVLLAPRDVLIQQVPLRVRQPDVLFLSAERTGVRNASDLSRRVRVDDPPDLVIDVLSPSNTQRDIEERLADYESIGVPEVWLASFPSRTIRVMRLAGAGYVEVSSYGMGDVVRSEVMPGFSLAVDDVYGPLLRQE